MTVKRSVTVSSIFFFSFGFQIGGCLFRMVLRERKELSNKVESGINGWEEICYEVRLFKDLCSGFSVVLVDLCGSCFAWRD